MATSNQKIRYDLEAAVSGEQDVAALARQLEGLANTLEGDLRTQALASAQALRELGAKQGAIDNFVGLKTEAQAAADRLASAQQAAQSFARELAASGNPTRTQAGQLEKLRDAVRDASIEMLQSRRSVEGARDALTQYGVSTSSLSAQQRTIKAAVEEQRATFDLLGESARVSADERVQAEARAAAAVQSAAQKEEAIAAQRQRLIEAVSAANNRAVGQAKAAEQARVSAATSAQNAERARAEMIERYNLREGLSQQALLARLEQVRAQYPRLGAAAQAAGFQQTKSAEAVSAVRGELGKLGDQLSTLRNLAGVALGGSLVGSLAKDLGEVADGYANVAARLKLATDGNEGFEQGMADVQRIAQDTNTELEATASLYTTLARTGKDAGLTAKAAQQEAASLTEVINQSIQLSGASSQAAQAAVTQLIQGLQAGVLRGENFNSVMEQSPRLARALADGLGVTIGQLRAMAEQGQLTGDVVRKGLGGQAQQIQQEFDKLPPTIGRAMQSLNNAWTVYVGETDKATGASRAAADAIDFMGRNLDTIVRLLMDVGQAAAAFTALRLAQSFLAIGTASTAAVAGITATAAAMRTTEVSSVAAAAGAGRMVAMLATLRTFTLVGLLANIQDIGKWLGEGAAKLMGYRDASDEVAAADRRAAAAALEHRKAQEAMAQQMQLATDAARGLTPAARELVSEFDKARKSGDGVADALGSIAKKANLSDTQGIATFTIALRDMAVQGKATGDEVRVALAQALKGEDLQAFEVRARAAFAGTKNGAELLALAMDAQLRAAVERTGLSFGRITSGMSEAARSAINDTQTIIDGMDRLKEQGADVALALTKSLGKGINTADSQKAFDALRSHVEAVRKVLGDQVANTFLQQIEDKARAAAAEVGGLGNALRQLGITSDQDLKRAADATRRLYEQVREAGGSAREQGEAFRKMAEAAIASGDETALAYARAQGAAQGFELVTDSAGRTVVRTMAEAKAAADAYRSSLQGATQDAKEHIGWLERMAKRNAAVKSVLKTDVDGFAVDAQGNRIVQTVENQQSVASKLEGMGLDAKAAQRLAAQVYDERGNYTPRSTGAFRDGDTLDALLARLVERANTRSGSIGGTRDVNVNLTIGGLTRTVQTNEEGAKALTESLQAARLAAGG